MPFLIVHTNAEVNNEDVFLNEAAEFVAAELRKPVRYVIVELNSAKKMIFGGNREIKSALVEMKSIGFGNKNDLAAKLADFLAEKLSLDKAYVNIHFINMPGVDLSIGGSLLG